MDPLSIFPLEIAVSVLKHIELEELLLSTRFISRSWNDILHSQVAHLMTDSYFLQIELGRSRVELQLKLKTNDVGTYSVYGETRVLRRVHHDDDTRYFPISAGIVNKAVPRTFISNPSFPEVVAIEESSAGQAGGRCLKASVKEISYANNCTNTGKLNTVALDLSISPIFTAEEDSVSESIVSCSIEPQELAKWIVLCRLAQGYQTPAELAAQNQIDRKLGVNGVIGPYRSQANSAGIWGIADKKIRA